MKKKQISSMSRSAFGLAAALGVAAPAVYGSGEAADQSRSSASEEGIRGLLSRAAVLRASPVWAEFRRIWREMDEYTPPEGDYRRSAMDQERVNKLRRQLSDVAQRLRESADELGISAPELEFFIRISHDRLQLLSWGNAMPLTRMMPPPISDQKDALLPVIESRIDSISTLRDAGLLSGDELELAVSDLLDSVQLYFLYDAISTSVNYSSFCWSVRWPDDPDGMEATIDSVRSAFSNMELPDSLAGEYSAQCDSLEAMLETSRESIPSVREMLLSLELI